MRTDIGIRISLPFFWVCLSNLIEPFSALMFDTLPNFLFNTRNIFLVINAIIQK